MAVTQYSGFVANAGTGYLVAAGIKALGMALVLGPVGWVVLIGAAVVVGLTAATLADHGVQRLSGTIYDSVRGRL